MGLDRTLPLTPGKTYTLRLIVDDTIATIYANDTALSARMYRRPGENASFILNQGNMSIHNINISRGRR
jgi:beta-fructofuranosidase